MLMFLMVPNNHIKLNLKLVWRRPVYRYSLLRRYLYRFLQLLLYFMRILR